MSDKVTLYGVDDDWGREPPRVVSAQAKKREKTYRLNQITTKPFLDYRVVLSKKSCLVSLTPAEALYKYIGRQAQIVRQGKRAAVLEAEAKKLLSRYEKEENHGEE